jgi:Tol biopolymer transport system component
MSDRFRENTTVGSVAVKKIAVFISLGLVAIFFLSCGGSGGSGDDGGSETAIFPPVVFMADKDTNGTIELYASFDDGANIIKLSGTMVFGGDVVDFNVSPNGIWVAYVADQDQNSLFELYVVPVDKTSNESAVKVSVPLAGSGLKERSAGSGDYLFAWAPDSSLVAYIADADDAIAELFELFSSTPDGKEQYLISELVNVASDVFDFKWAPDSTLIAYVADQDVVGELALYVVPSDVENASVSVSGAMAGNGIEEDPTGSGNYAFAWAPGRCGLVPGNFCLAYIADQLLQNKFELFTSKPDGTVNLLISGPFNDDRDVDDFAWAPDSQLVAYTANQSDLFAIDLYTAPPNNISSSQIHSNGVAPGQEVSAFKWAPDSSRIAFTSDKDSAVADFYRLFSVQPVNNNDILISGGLLATSDVTEFEWSPDSSLIAYLVDAQDIELYTTFPASGSSIQIGDVPIFGGDVFEFEWAPNSSRIAYKADYDVAGVIELFSSTPDNDVTDQVSGTLVSGGDVGEFNWASDSSGVGYIADQDTINVDELFASKPNGNDNTKLSGRLVSGGDVARFEWVP